ncbi:MAG: hypothetical protein ACI9X4_002249, partial [Glaciecola sp.]
HPAALQALRINRQRWESGALFSQLWRSTGKTLNLGRIIISQAQFSKTLADR